MGQGPCLATSPNPLVQRQSPCRATSDDQQWQEDPGDGRRGMGHPGEESMRDRGTTTARLSRPPAPAHLHSEEGWHAAPTPLVDPHDA
jgi:hypothetical protein